MKKILPTNNLAFQKIFASVENTDILAGLNNDFFFFTPLEIHINNPYSIELVRKMLKEGEPNKLRTTGKDISASFVTSEFISEMQIHKRKFFEERFLYYPFRAYCDNYAVDTDNSRENHYSSIKPVYALNFLVESHFTDNDALRVFELYDPKRKKTYGKDLIFIAFFELKKSNIETENQRYWRDFFVSGEVSENAPGYIKKAADVIAYANLREEEREMLAAIDRAEADYYAEMEYVRDESYAQGISQGISQGKEEGIIETARRMLIHGCDTAFISQVTSLPPDVIQSIEL